MKKEGNSVLLTREELYEMVWAQPVVKLAKEFGVSDVAVAKACRRHKIPLPGRGYWRRLETGQKLSRQPLPKLDNAFLNSITFSGGILPGAKKLAEDSTGTKIIVSEEPDELNPLARQALVRLTHESPDNHGLIAPKDTLDIRASENQLGRAIRIMDALIKALETLGHKVEVRAYSERNDYRQPNPPPAHKTQVNVKGVIFTFGMEESYKRVPHIPSKSEEREIALGHKWNVPEYDFIPTGYMALKIKEPYLYGLRGTWSEGKKYRLEDRLNSFIQGLIIAADTEIERRIKEERERKQREEEERRRREAEQRRLHEEKLTRRLEHEIATWKLAQDARKYVAKLDSLGPHDPETEEWIRWIHSYIERVDPLNLSLEG
jgi:hypothetical protein